jgi:hypothetical protein
VHLRLHSGGGQDNHDKKYYKLLQIPIYVEYISIILSLPDVVTEFLKNRPISFYLKLILNSTVLVNS